MMLLVVGCGGGGGVVVGVCGGGGASVGGGGGGEEESESGDPRAGAALEPSQPAAGPEDPGLIHRTQGYTVLAANS